MAVVRQAFRAGCWIDRVFFFIPLTTDAPVYYWPFATVGLIVVNVLVFAGLFTGALDPTAGWLLVHGDGIHPHQWLLSMFSHADIGHLLGNMLFLWIFGLIVEGKLGWLRFLACYVAIGAGESAIEQILFLGYSGDPSGSLGASTAIYGIMAMAAVWAPKNEVSFIYFVWLIFILAGTFEISIGLLALLYIGFDFLMLLIFHQGSMSTSWLHVAGALLGFPLAVVMLKRGMVDCEGWDMFRVWSGDYGSFVDEEKQNAEASKKIAERKQRQSNRRQDSAREQFDQYLQAGNAAAAITLYEKLREAGQPLRVERAKLSLLIRQLHQEKQWARSAPLMAEVIAQAPDSSDGVRLMLAQICVMQLERPGRALELLAAAQVEALPEKQQQLAAKITRRAEQMQATGVVELDDEHW